MTASSIETCFPVPVSTNNRTRRRRLPLLVVSWMMGFLMLQSVTAQEADNSRELRQTPSTEELLQSFSAAWSEEGWNQPAGRRQYLRSDDDASWKQRMLALQSASGGDDRVVGALTKALDHENEATRVLAAQALGFTTGELPVPRLIDAIRSDPSEAVKLYLVDSLGMRGVGVEEQLAGWRSRNGDVRKHLAYAAERAGAEVEPEVINALTKWDSRLMNSAAVGQQAPDFELANLTGGKIKLSDYRGNKNVVLVFIYGDT